MPLEKMICGENYTVQLLKNNVNGLIDLSDLLGSSTDEKIDSSQFKSNQAVTLDVSLPSPYDAETFEELSAKVRQQLTGDGEVTTWEALTLEQRKVCLHPSIVYIPKGFNGYRYWCAHTPYPASNSYFENPCIAASNDAINWVVPEGLENPLDTSPANGYNRDTHLYYDEKSNQLVMIYLARTTSPLKNSLLCMTSKDGVNWADKFEIWSGVRGVSDYASPSIYFDDFIGKWIMYGHDLDANREIIRKESDELLVVWGDASNQVCNIPQNAGFDWWHSHITGARDGSILGLIQENASAGGSGLVYGVTSDDGVNFTVSNKPFVKFGGHYRSSFCKSSGDGIVVITGALNSPTLKLSIGVFENQDTYNSISTKCKLGGIASDTFTRVDSSDLGVSDSGDEWLAYSVNDKISIVNNLAVNSTASNCRSTINSGKGAYKVTCKVKSIGTQSNVLFRFLDSSNFYRFRFVEKNVQKFVGGDLVDNYSLPIDSAVDNSEITIINTPTNIKVFLDGCAVASIDVPATDNASLCGLQASGANQTAFEYFAITDI